MLATFITLTILLALACVTLWVLRERLRADLTARLTSAEKDAALLTQQIADHARRQQEETARYETLRKQFEDTFNSLAGKALESSSEQFLKLARENFAAQHEQQKAEIDKRREAVDQLVKPIGETLKQTRERLDAIDKAHTERAATLAESLKLSTLAGDQLRAETARLANALSKPQVRGAYGEMQLERIAEIAGMRAYCDFDTQHTVTDGQGGRHRPDMVVRLPNERVIVIDAKTNTQAYMEAISADTPELAERHLQQFADHVAQQVRALSRKEYRDSVEGSIDFVVMFIPADQLVDAALERKPDLLEAAYKDNVILASPSTLIGLLRAVHVGWREKTLSDNAHELFTLGKELHERAATALTYAAEIGKAIETAGDKYNRFVGSVEGRLMPTLRKFEDKGAKSTKELDAIAAVEVRTREMKTLTSND
ncbi:MAG: DNA recombination protein RmuC [Phycisphaeraceae bacterium]|nr:DNA recombination protein RmuC [Phycisphaeraceae bacterium]MCB9847195.1 DNA recombination protein RmuC [Phycisphaeraceae bacterium]